MHDLLHVIHDFIPNDHSRQYSVQEAVREFAEQIARPFRVLDLGSGDGRALDMFRTLPVAVEYVGLDIADSPEVRSRTRDDAQFHTYDGENIPFPDESFDLVYSSQVFEHVRRPDAVTAEVRRVLKPGGTFLCGHSFLEPYHSYSIFNITPYGAVTIVQDAGLVMRWLRPGIDGATLIVRAFFWNRPFFDRFWKGESPLNYLLSRRGRRNGFDHRQVNAMKLLVCGYLVFAACRPEARPET